MFYYKTMSSFLKFNELEYNKNDFYKILKILQKMKLILILYFIIIE